MSIDTAKISTLSDLQAIHDGGIVTNDRGNGAAGPMYLEEQEVRGMDSELGDVEITMVTEEEDPQAWELARDAHRAHKLPAPEMVGVGKRMPGDNGHQDIFSV